jgi:hypothetical protein
VTDAPPPRRIRWAQAFRIVPTRHPPIQLFERVADPADWEALAEIESLTNPRVRQEIGEISVIAPDERVAGPNATWVMAPFTHLGRPSRFSDGRYGVYYAARARETAVRETLFHMGRFFAATAEPACDVDVRVLVGSLDASFHDLRADARFAPLHDPDDWTASQVFGAALRARGSNGVVYDSVRHSGGHCLGAFRPRAVGLPSVGAALVYHWSGARMDRYFDYEAEVWVSV